jgi:hypothetical protein
MYFHHPQAAPGSQQEQNGSTNSIGIAVVDDAAASFSHQCSFLKRRIGFRTVELVMQPLPDAVAELFGSKRGFDFEVPPQKIRAILGRDGAGQWANDAEGQWSHFPGDNVNVSGMEALLH